MQPEESGSNKPEPNPKPSGRLPWWAIALLALVATVVAALFGVGPPSRFTDPAEKVKEERGRLEEQRGQTDPLKTRPEADQGLAGPPEKKAEERTPPPRITVKGMPYTPDERKAEEETKGTPK